MTYNERVEATKSMTLEELLFSYHSAMDTAENRRVTIISLQYLLKERNLQIEALYDTVQDLTDERDKLKTEVNPDEPKTWQQEAAIKTARQVEQPGTVTITRKEYGALLASRDMLEALEAAGVDNWSCYEDAMALLKAA